MKKILLLFIFIYILSSDCFSQSSPVSNIISDFNAKITKKNIVLNWKIINPKNLSGIKLKSKKAGTAIYESVKDIDINNYLGKEKSDTLEIYSYTLKYKPEENGVYYLELVLTDMNSVEVNSSEIKIGFSELNEFKLYQNTPNPFNPSTTITYEILTPTKVSLKVYDLSGKEVDVIVDEFQQRGFYKVDFNMNKYGSFSSGIYFYKLQSNSSSEIRKMIFTK
jgi:hypothetical protein